MQYQSMEKTEHSTCNHSKINSNFSPNENAEFKTKVVAIIGYITLIGWLAAMLLHGSHKSAFVSFHLRQSLGLIITGAILALLPLIGWLLNIIICLAWLYALFHVVQGHQTKVPFLGDFYQTHLDFIK